MKSNSLTVVWDGRRQGPGGAMLFAEEVITKAAPETVTARRCRVAGESQRRVRVSLQVRPQSYRELIASTRLSESIVNGALYKMKLAGEVIVVSERRASGKFFSRSVEAVYGLNSEYRA